MQWQLAEAFHLEDIWATKHTTWSDQQSRFGLADIVAIAT
jgi:hypothetical protein